MIFIRSVTTYYGSVTVCYWISSDISYIREDFRVLFLILFDALLGGFPWFPGDIYYIRDDLLRIRDHVTVC